MSDIFAQIDSFTSSESSTQNNSILRFSAGDISATFRDFFWLKRMFDLMLVTLSLPMVVLVCLLVFFLNPLLNPGPLFFTQVRVGFNGQPFRMLKLRSMTGSTCATKFATDETHRITRFGAFLRSRRLDELPQVINVLLGQMSVIGPRPEQPAFYEEFERTIPNYSARQAVSPGITGLAQVELGYAGDADSTCTKLQYDLRYIANMGLRMEVYVFAQTLRVMVTGFGAR